MRNGSVAPRRSARRCRHRASAQAHSQARPAGEPRSAAASPPAPPGARRAVAPAARTRRQSTAADADPRAAAASAAARSGRSRTAAPRRRGSGRPPRHSALTSVFSSAAPAHDSVSGWNACSTPRSSDRGRFAPRATSATRPCSLGERLDDEARLAIRIRVQYERRLVVAALAQQSSSSVRPQVPSTRAASASRRCPTSRSSRAPRRRGTRLPPNSASMSPRACDAIAFIRAPPSPIRIALWLDLSTSTVGANPAQVAFVLEAFDDHGRRVRHLVAELAKDLLAHELGGEEALVAIGQLVVGVERRSFGQMLRDRLASAPAGRCRARREIGTSAANSRNAAISRDARQQRRACP